MPSVSRPVTRTEYNKLIDLVEGMQDMMADIDYRLTGLEDFQNLENMMLAPPKPSKWNAKSPQGSLERRLNALRRGGTNRRSKSSSKTRRRHR